MSSAEQFKNHSKYVSEENVTKILGKVITDIESYLMIHDTHTELKLVQIEINLKEATQQADFYIIETSVMKESTCKNI